MNEPLDSEIRELRALYWSDRDPDGRGFAPLADAYRRAGNLSDALELLQDGLERHPDFASGHVVAARIHLAREDTDAAMASLERVLTLDDENTEALSGLGDLHEERGSLDTALDLYRRLSMAVPGDDGVMDRVKELSDRVQGANGSAKGVGAADPVEEPAGSLPDLNLDPAPHGTEPSTEPGPDFEPLVLGSVDMAADDLALDPGGVPDALGPEHGAATDDLAPEPPAVDALTALHVEGIPEDVDWRIPDDEHPLADVAEEDLFTQTLGELYADQGLTQRAVEVYRHLVEADPDDPELRARLAALEGIPIDALGIPDTAPEVDALEHAEPEAPPKPGAEPDLESLAEDMARGPEDADGLDTPFAWSSAEPEAPQVEPGPPIADYLAAVLAWTPTGTEPDCVDITSLAPEPQETEVEASASSPGATPIVPVEALAPEPSSPDPGDGRVAQFQNWMDRLKK